MIFICQRYLFRYNAAMEHLSIKFIILGLVFYTSANIVTQFLIAVPLSGIIAVLTDAGETAPGLYPPSVVISVTVSKIFASIATAGYLVKYVKAVPLYHALVVGILGAIVGSLFNSFNPEQNYLRYIIAFTSIAFVVLATWVMKRMAASHA